jgi:hypothetical protein
MARMATVRSARHALISFLAMLLAVLIVYGAAATVHAVGSANVLIAADPARRPPDWFTNLTAWRLAHQLPNQVWIIGFSDNQPTLADARSEADLNARQEYGIIAPKGVLQEEDHYLRVYGPDPHTEREFYLAVLYRAPAQSPEPVTAFYQCRNFGRNAVAAKRLFEARSYFLTAEAIRLQRPDLPPILEMPQIDRHIRMFTEQVHEANAVARSAVFNTDPEARQKAREDALRSFEHAQKIATDYGIDIGLEYVNARIFEIQMGILERWVIFSRETMKCSDPAASEVVQNKMEETLASCGISAISRKMDVIDPKAKMTDLIHWAREDNAAVMVVLDMQADFRTWVPGEPASDAKLAAAHAAGSIKVVNLQSGKVVWQQQIETNGFGPQTEREACEDALSNMGTRAGILIVRAKIGE